MKREEMLAEIAELDRRSMMLMHLDGNLMFCFPAGFDRSTLLDLALEAVDTANTYTAQYEPDGNILLDIPEGTPVYGKPVPAGAKMGVWGVIEWLHLDSLVYDVLDDMLDEAPEEMPDDATVEDYSI